MNMQSIFKVPQVDTFYCSSYRYCLGVQKIIASEIKISHAPAKKNLKTKQTSKSTEFLEK